MSFEPAKAKLKLFSHDNTALEVEAQYNPKELQVDKSIPWTKPSQANNANQKGIHLEFTGAEGRTMTVELLFDGYENNGIAKGKKSIAVKDLIETLEKMSSVIDAESKDENKRRPHRCSVSWGTGGMPRFDCVIESLSTKYTMFSSDGVPLRATCTVKLKEADVVAMAKAPPASGGAAPAKTAPAGGTK
jgi:hypothetical protein